MHEAGRMTLDVHAVYTCNAYRMIHSPGAQYLFV